MHNYITVDFANTFFRCRHIAARQADDWAKVGFAIHTVLASIHKAWRDQRADHVVICLEGRSWRKDFYKPYKANRAVTRAAQTEAEQEQDRMFYAAFDDVTTFLRTRTNCTVLQHPELEADDLIAGWVQAHPDASHTIISSDTDYVQLISENVSQYDGVQGKLITSKGVFDDRGKPIKDKKTKEALAAPDPQWLLFEKCIRGDATDNVFSAYPGVRTKGTKNRVGLQEAFLDRDRKGYNWNNLMLQKWTDHNGEEHKVLDDYIRNCTLIDLAAQPENIRTKVSDTVAAGSVPNNRPMVGAQFLKFCGKYELIKLSDQAQAFGELLGAAYPEKSAISV